MKVWKALLAVVASLFGLAVGAIVGFLATALVLGPAARIGESSADFSLWGMGIGGVFGAVVLGGLARMLTRPKI